jgi:hypothetical protein
VRTLEFLQQYQRAIDFGGRALHRAIFEVDVKLRRVIAHRDFLVTIEVFLCHQPLSVGLN